MRDTPGLCIVQLKTRTPIQPPCCYYTPWGNNEKDTMPLDLSLYLVTDSTPAILKGRDLCDVVEAALKGGTQTLITP